MATKPKRSIPSLRRALLKVHRDLLNIHYKIGYLDSEDNGALTTFEQVVLTLEDRRFFSHSGFDIIAIFRDIFRFFTFRKPGGASTIDMQFVRVSTGYYDRTIKRKLYEIFLAQIIQFRYSKIAILRSYIDIAYFGTGLTGATSAALLEFNKYLDELDVRESALIASQLVFPRPKKPTEKWLKRRLRRANYVVSVYPRQEKKLKKLKSRKVF